MTKKASVVERIVRFNQGRDPERLALKYRALRDNPFAFLRGTCHLFQEDLPDEPVLRDAPPAWACGDLHLENFGTYKGDNRLVYFDLNDFDEAALAPCTREIVRLLTSILVAAPILGVDADGARELCRQCVAAYRQALAGGKARWVDRDGASGLIGDLFADLKGRKRADFIASRTEIKGGKMILRSDGKRALPVDAEQRERVMAFMAGFAAAQETPDFFRPLDVARRIAGTGSLGVDRYAILVHGKGGGDGHYLLDLKAALPSALAPCTQVAQPAWPGEAERVVAVQHRCQAVSPAFLRAVDFAGRSCVLKALQPTQDRVNLADAKGDAAALAGLLRVFGEVTAWSQLRSAGRQGSATADRLIDFGGEIAWVKPLLKLSEHAAAGVLSGWREFRDGSGGL